MRLACAGLVYCSDFALAGGGCELVLTCAVGAAFCMQACRQTLASVAGNFCIGVVWLVCWCARGRELVLACVAGVNVEACRGSLRLGLTCAAGWLLSMYEACAGWPVWLVLP